MVPYSALGNSRGAGVADTSIGDDAQPQARLPAWTADHTFVGLDLDLDEGGFVDTVADISLPATGALTRFLRRAEFFGTLLEPGPLGTAMAGGAALLAARASGARCLLLLALAAEQRPRQYRPGSRSLASCTSSVSIRFRDAFARLRSRAFSLDNDLIVAFRRRDLLNVRRIADSYALDGDSLNT